MANTLSTATIAITLGDSHWQFTYSAETGAWGGGMDGQGHAWATARDVWESPAIPRPVRVEFRRLLWAAIIGEPL